MDCDKFYLEQVICAVQTVSNHYVNNCGFDGVNIMNASGDGSEQSIFHLHFHILPRKKSDGMHTFPQLPKNKLSLKRYNVDFFLINFVLYKFPMLGQVGRDSLCFHGI